MSSDSSSANSAAPATTAAAAKEAGAKALRAMLPRGAACDLCRSRKVKCDSQKPVCSQCKKSARGNSSEINCVYEGGASARAGGKKSKPISSSASVLPAPPAPPTTVVGVPARPPPAPLQDRKRDRDPASDDDEDEYRRAALPFTDDAREPHATGPRKRPSAGAGQRVETLVERISELERRLRLQSQPVPTPLHTHVRASASPPFYPSPYLPSTASAPMEARRSMSFSNDVGSEPSVKEITSAWTPESSIRFTGRQLGAEPPETNGDSSNTDNSNNGNGNGSSYPRPAPSYASFIPPLPHLAAFDDGHPAHDAFSFPPTSSGAPISRHSSSSSSNPTSSSAFANGSSYPPLNYSAGLALTGASATNGFSAAVMNGLQASTSAYGADSKAQSRPADDYWGHQAQYNGVQPEGGDFFDYGLRTPSTDNSLAPSPEDSLSLDASLLQMLYPAWPKSLPLPTTVHHLATVFFTRATIPSTMFNRTRFFLSLELAPDDPNFPHTALLHAICAYASVWVSPETLGGVGEGGQRKYWESDKSPRDYHFRTARECIDGALAKAKGSNLFQVLQSILLCAYLAYQSASFTELWLLSGLATRLCTPLGLNHIVPWDFALDKAGDPFPDWRSFSNGSQANMVPSLRTHALLPPPRDIEEHYERTATFWVAFSIDRHTSASTDWSTSIDELDISTRLPALTAAVMEHPAVREPTFLDGETVPVGALGLYIKAVVLLGRVINYLQRLPRYQTMPDGDTCTTIRAKLKATPEFISLDYALTKFRTTTSADFFNAGSSINGHLASAYAIPHAASILLHEPFCDRWDKSPSSSIARCLTSAKCVVNSTYVLYQSSNDLSSLDPFIGFCWTVIGRALVRDHAIRRLWGDIDSAQYSKTLAEHCVAFTSRCKMGGVGILDTMAATLKGHLENPDALLPPDFNSPEKPWPCRPTPATA